MRIIDDRETGINPLEMQLMRFMIQLGSSSLSGTFLSLTIVLLIIGVAGILIFFEPDMNFTRMFLPANFSLNSTSNDFNQILFYFGIFATIIGFAAKTIVKILVKAEFGDWIGLAAIPIIIAIAALDFILFVFGFFSKGYADALFMSTVMLGILIVMTGMAISSLLASIAFEKLLDIIERLVKENNK